MIDRRVDFISDDWTSHMQADQEAVGHVCDACVRPPYPGRRGVFITRFIGLPAPAARDLMGSGGLAAHGLELCTGPATHIESGVSSAVSWRFQARWRSGRASGAAYVELMTAATHESELVLYLERPGQPWLRPLWPRQRLEALADRLTRWTNASWRASAR